MSTSGDIMPTVSGPEAELMQQLLVTVPYLEKHGGACGAVRRLGMTGYGMTAHITP